MKSLLRTVSAALFCATTATASVADEGNNHGDDSTTPKASRHAHDGAHEHGDSAAGSSGDPAKITKVVEVSTLGTMRYEPSSFVFKRGDKAKFVVTNRGQVRHEFGIGTKKIQEEHAEMMQAMPDMVHEDANSVVIVEPGETNSICAPGLCSRLPHLARWRTAC